ncbi:GNAT family N-acetyltransferase, partial [Salmonella enterica subsp. enterica serovar Oslo]|nr:GNAT family N-acetyltransferase [Salmonella enterica subsp. enterica serovar Oslo]
LRHGIGKALLDYVQQRFPLLSLEENQKEQSAVNFYQAQGFLIEDSARLEDTAHPTANIIRQADHTP